MTAHVETPPPPAARAAERQIIVLLGPPGAGKGTQAVRLAEALGLPHVSTGELFRTAIRSGDPLGQQVKRYVERGALVPDELTTQVVIARLAQPDAAAGVILDGYPRTRRQAESLDELLERMGDRVTNVLYIEVDPAELVSRLSGRRVCADQGHVYHVTEQPPVVDGVCDSDGSPLVQRADDEAETIRARLERQLPPMYEVVDHYADRDVLCAVPGSGSIDEVSQELLRAASMAKRPR